MSIMHLIFHCLETVIISAHIFFHKAMFAVTTRTSHLVTNELDKWLD